MKKLQYNILNVINILIKVWLRERIHQDLRRTAPFVEATLRSVGTRMKD